MMPECEWCAGFSVAPRRRVPNPGWVKKQPGDLEYRNVLYVCRNCQRVLEAAAREGRT